MDLTPILTVACLFLWDIHHSQIQHFQETIVGRKYRLGFGDLLELTVKSLNCIGGIDQTADRFRVLKISRKIRPVVLPGFRDFRIFSAPFFIKAVQFR